MASRRKTRARKSPAPRPSERKWSAGVTAHSDALDLEPSIFGSASPKRIAASLKSSAEASTRRKSTSYQSAMSMLNFYINRAGAHLPASRRDALERAKGELRKAFGRA
jgi:Protein of unknown function (DUF3175)